MNKMNGDQVVHYKIFLCAAGYEPEIRRITIDKDICNNYFYLKQKILAIFPTLKDVVFTISWKDCEGDIIRICTDDELSIALREMETLDFKKIYVNATPQGKEGPLHPDVVCDGCEQHVQGFRYKCIVCYDYDLCPDCERSQVHPDHPMLRIPLPLSSEMPFGRRFSRDISRMSKHLERLFQQGGDTWSDKKAKGDYSKASHSENKKHKMKFCPRNEMHNFIHNIVMNQLEKLRGSDGDINVNTSNNERKQESNHPESQPSSSATNVFPILDEQKNFVNILTNGLNSFLDPLGIDVVVEVDPVKQEATEHQPESQQSASGTDKKGTDEATSQASASGVVPQPPTTEVTSTSSSVHTDPASVPVTNPEPVALVTPVSSQAVNKTPPFFSGISGSLSSVGVTLSHVGVSTPLSAMGFSPSVAQCNLAPVVTSADSASASNCAVPTPAPVSYSGPIPATVITAPIPSPAPAISLGQQPVHTANGPLPTVISQDQLPVATPQPSQNDPSLLDNSWTIINPGMVDSMCQQQLTPPTTMPVPAPAPPPVPQPAPQTSQRSFPEWPSGLGIDEAIIFMRHMGYEDEDWLRQLVLNKEGNIQEVLRFLSPISKPSSNLAL